jgi:ferredoxin
MRVTVDQPGCTGAGYCAEVAGSVFVLLESGLATVRDADGAPMADGGGTEGTAVAEEHGAAVRDAIGMCPGSCIRSVATP